MAQDYLPNPRPILTIATLKIFTTYKFTTYNFGISEKLQELFTKFLYVKSFTKISLFTKSLQGSTYWLHFWLPFLFFLFILYTCAYYSFLNHLSHLKILCPYGASYCSVTFLKIFSYITTGELSKSENFTFIQHYYFIQSPNSSFTNRLNSILYSYVFSISGSNPRTHIVFNCL